MQDLINKINQVQPVCYLELTAADLKFWNFLAAPQPLFNTKLLFTAAARPHFDYFFTRVDYLALKDQKFINLVEDEKFKRQLSGFSGKYLSPESVIESVLPIIAKKQNITLITTPDYAAGQDIKAHRTIVIDDINLFGNPEPIWRKIQKQLPKTTDVFLLALGMEKFLIGPRLKLKYNLPVLDIGAKPKAASKLTKKFKALAGRIIPK